MENWADFRGENEGALVKWDFERTGGPAFGADTSNYCRDLKEAAKRMFFRRLNDEVKLSLSIPQYAEELFELTDRNRAFLKRWLPWLDTVKKPSDTREFIEAQLMRFQRGEALHVTIFHRDGIAGVLGYNRIDRINDIGYIGYWLAQEYNGKGMMTESVKDLIALGFDYYSLNRIEIHCAAENRKSRAIPERLGFRQEGVIRQAEKVCGGHLDLVVYGLLKQEPEADNTR
jgi:ribosomal-protein-serine acetyltransferase